MVRDAGTKSASPMWCRSSFFTTTPRMNSSNSVVAGTAAHLRVQIVVPHGEQAGADFSVAGDPDAAAMSAEGMRYGCNDADLTYAVFKTVATRGFRTRVRDLNQRPVFRHARQNFL